MTGFSFLGGSQTCPGGPQLPAGPERSSPGIGGCGTAGGRTLCILRSRSPLACGTSWRTAPLYNDGHDQQTVDVASDGTLLMFAALKTRPPALCLPAVLSSSSSRTSGRRPGDRYPVRLIPPPRPSPTMAVPSAAPPPRPSRKEVVASPALFPRPSPTVAVTPGSPPPGPFPTVVLLSAALPPNPSPIAALPPGAAPPRRSPKEAVASGAPPPRLSPREVVPSAAPQ
mmetsp:Transcript_5744/g.16119  ORF Transcript_5744/g.16119 Transcript_5744/m.16119 type:complete len:227 (-) Transcript_5744:187-867(-)